MQLYNIIRCYTILYNINNVIHLYFNNCSIVLSWRRVGGSDYDKQPCYSRWGKGWPLKNGWILAELLVLFSYKLTGWFLLLLYGYWSVNHHKPEKYSSAAKCYSHTWHFSNCKEQTHKNIAQQHTWHLSISQEQPILRPALDTLKHLSGSKFNSWASLAAVKFQLKRNNRLHWRGGKWRENMTR